jgi:hypothetical protein
MNEHVTPTLASLYHEDETAWLEMMAQLLLERRFDELDHEHLAEFLRDMSRRDKREVLSRLTTLLVHLLKWDYQPERQSSSWQSAILHQREELGDLLESRTLWNYAEEVLPKAYRRAVREAALETGLDQTTFPAKCTMSLEALIAADRDSSAESSADEA